MRRLIIDCQKKEENWQELTPSEEVERLAETERAKAEKRAEDRKTAKAQLIKALAELREMKLNVAIFDIQDITAKQNEVDGLKDRLVI